MRHDLDRVISTTKVTAEPQPPLFLLFRLLVALTLLLASCYATPSYAAGGDIIWQAGDEMPGKQEAKASVVDSQGNAVIAGYQNTTGDTNDNYYTVKFKADGSGILWRALYDRSGASDQATAVVIDRDDNVVVTGFSWNGLNYDIYTVKYDGATGAVLWQNIYNGSANGNDVGSSLAVDSLNNVYVGAYSQDGNGNFTFLVLKYLPTGPTPDGKPLWQAIADGATTGVNKVNSIAAGTGGVAITGQTWNGSAFDILTVKFDFNGTKLWEQRYSTGAANSCLGKYVKIDQTGDVVITGTAFNGIDLDIYTARYNGVTGAVIWEKTYNGAYDDEPNGMAIGPNGNIYITGYTWTLTAQNDFYTAKYNGATGALIWEKGFNSGDGYDDITSATGIVVDPLGDVFVTGYTIVGKNFDFQTIKYKKDNGNQLWQKSFNGPANKNDRPIGIGLSPTGEVLVAGWSETVANDLDNYLIKYDPGLLNAPTDVTAQALTNNSVRLTWVSNSATEDGFSIERCQNAGCTSFAEIATTLAGVTAYTESGLTPATYYSYRIRSFSSAAGYSHYSNTATALTVVVDFVPPVWSYLYNGLANRDDFANAIAVGPDNNPVVAGQSNDFPVGYTSGITSFDYLLTKLNRTDISVVWSDRYNDPTDASDIATCVAVDSDNGVVVSGYATMFNGTSSDVNSLYTIRYPAGGPPALRADQYNGPVAGGATDDRAVAVAIASASDSSNNVIVVGYGMSAAGNDDIYVVKYNPDGTRAWAATPFDANGGDDFPTSVLLALDGSIYVTGYTEKGASTDTYNFFTARYDGTTGVRIWSDQYSVTASGDNRGASLALDSTGDLYVTGYAVNPAGNKDIHTIKYKGGSSTVQRLWERSFDGIANGDDQGVSVRIDPVDDAVLVAGTTLSIKNALDSSPIDHDFTLVRYSPAGDTIWAKTYQRPANNDFSKAMGIDADGTIYLAGDTGNGVTTDSLTAKIDYLGNIISATLYNGAANSFDQSTSIAINSLNEVFVAGYTENVAGNADFLVYKIAPDASLPSVPYKVTSIPGYASVTLNWLDRSTLKDGFRIERKIGVCSTANNNAWDALGTVAAGTLTYTDSGLNSGTTYCYHIQTFQNGGAVSRWGEKQVTTLSPPAPGNITSLPVNSTQINLTWGDTTIGETAFRIERCTGAECTAFVPIGTASANATSYSDTSVCGATVYRYRILSSGPGWESPASNVTGNATTTAPVAPVLTGNSINEAEIDLSWTDQNTDETGYVIERCSGSGCTEFNPIATLAPNTTGYKDMGLTANAAYTYRVKGYKTASCTWEALSNAVTVTATLNPPTGMTASAVNTTTVNLTWTDNTATETGFTVEKCTGSGCVIFSDLANVGTNVTSYSDIAACGGENATYRVKATRSAVTLSNDGGGCWTKHIPLAIGNFQPNYQLKLTLPYDSDMQASFGDIRFVDSVAGVELPYWIESKADGQAATVWLKTGMNNALAVYFGNANATSSSNGSSVFDFFDDFEGGALNAAKWNATGAYALSGGTLQINTGSLYSIATVVPTPQNRAFEMKSQWLSGASSYSGLNIANAQSTQGGNSGANALAYFMSDGGTTANLLPFAANGMAASYNIASGTMSTTVSTGGVLYNPFVSHGQNTRKPATGVWSPPGGGAIKRIHVRTATESCCDRFRIYNAAGILLGEYRGTVDTWLDIAPTTGIYTTFITDYSVQYGFGGDVPEVVVDGISAVNALSAPRIVGFEFQDATQINYFVKELNYSEVLRKSYTGSWNIAPYLWLGYYTGAASGSSDGDDIMVDWVRVRKYAATEPTVTLGAKETTACFTFGSPWEGSYTNTASATTPTPTTPVISASRVSESQVNLNWTDTNADRSGFTLERCAGVGCSNFTPVGGVLAVGTTGYSDTGLTPDTSYTYRLNVFKAAACNWTSPSLPVTVVTTLYEPINLTATANNTTQITLNWTDRTGSETGFRIERCAGSGCTTFAEISPSAAANATSYADNSVCEGLSYRYQIRATNGSWYSAYSTPPAAAAASAAGTPVLSATSPFETQVNLSWTDSTSDETGFMVERCVGAGCSDFTLLATKVAGVTTHNDTGLTPGTSYTYQVKVYKTATCSWEKVSNPVTIMPLVAGPTGLTATTAGTTQINLAWTRTTTSETGFKVERCIGVGCSDFVQVGTAVAGSSSYNDTSVCSGTTYRYQVRATNNSVPWDSSYSNIATAITLASSNLLADPGFENATSSWSTAVGTLTGTSFDTATIKDGARSLKLTVTGAQLGRSQAVTVSPGRQYSLSGWLNASLSAGTVQCDVSGTNIDSTGIAIASNDANNNSGWVNFSETVVIPAGTTSVNIRCFANATSQGIAYVDAVSFAPADFILTATRASEVQINLTWPDSVMDESGYQIERCTGTICADADFALVNTTTANATSYNNSGLAVNTTYTYRIRGIKTATCGWNGSYSSTAGATTTISAPTLNSVTPNNTTQITLAWTDTTGSESGFKIERCAGSSCTDFAQIGTAVANAVSYVDASLAYGTLYRYQIRATNATVPWDSGYSSIVSATTPTPLAPANLTATRGSDETRINLAWTDGTTDETGYKVERCEGSGCSNFAQIAAPAANVASYNDTGLKGNTSYTYRVSAYKSATNPWTMSSTVSATTTLTSPVLNSATPNNTTQITIAWTDTTASESGFKVERCTGSSCTDFVQVGTAAANAVSYADMSAAYATTYRYQIRATNATVPWDSGYSSILSATTPTPLAPANLVATRGSDETRINLAWSDSTTDETGYKVERCEGAGCSNFIQIGSNLAANTLSYGDSGLKGNTTYNYRVSAYKTATNPWTMSSTVSGTTTLVAPASFSVTTPNSTQANLNWTDNSATETGFRIERCIGAGCTDFVEIYTTAANAVSYTDSPLTSSTTYRYQIRAINATVPWDSPYTTIFTVTTPSQGTPSNLATSAIGSRVTLSWTRNTVDETGFTIQRCLGTVCSDTDYAQIGQTAAGVLTYQDSTVCSGTTYSYRVSAYRTSYYTTPYSVSTTVTPSAQLPVVTATRGSEIQINISWTDANTDKNGFRVERCIGSGCSEFTTVADNLASTVLTYSDTSLLPNYTYTYRVKGFNNTATCGWETTSASASQQTTVSAPAGLTATVAGMTQINLSWSDTTATETGFRIERCTGSGCTGFAEIAITSGSATTWSDTGLASGTSYSYRIRATKSTQYSWDSGYSNTASATTQGTPAAPTALSAQTISASQINLSWSDTATADGYHVERCSGSGCSSFAQIATVFATPKNFTDAGLVTATTYCYRVRGYKTSTWTSAYSATSCAVTNIDSPTTLTATAVNSTLVQLTWVDSTADVSGFNLESQLWNGEWVVVASLGPQVTSYMDAVGIEPQKSYAYRIRAFSGAQYSSYSNQATVSTPAYNASDAPCIVADPSAPTISSIPVTLATEGVPYSYQVMASAVENRTLSYTLAVKPGGMAISPTGLVTWVPDYGQSGSQNVTIRVIDSEGHFADQHYAIAIANENSAPSIISTPVTVAVELHPYGYQVTATDPEDDLLSYTLVSAPSGMSISADGFVSWIPTADQFGDSGVVVKVSDGSLSATQNFTVSVGHNSAPVITSTAPVTASDGIVYSYQVAASDPDGDSIYFALTSPPAGMNITGSGLVSWTPTRAQADAGTVSVTVLVSDGSLSTSQPFTIALSLNHMPIITSAPVTTASEGLLYSYGVAAYAPIAGDTLSYSLTTAPAGMSINSSGVISWTPGMGQGGSGIPVTVAIQAGGATATQSYAIAAPYITAPPTQRASVGTPYSYSIAANAVGRTGTIVYSLVTAPTGMTINSSTGVISWTPSAGQTGSNSVTVKATIGTYTPALYATRTFSVAVPFITSTAVTTAAVGAPYSYGVAATDPAGGSFTYALTTAPTGMTINASSGVISWTPAAGQGGSAIPVTVSATSAGAVARQSYTISVVAITSTPVTSATTGNPYSYQIVASGSALTYAFDTAPTGMTASASGLVSWTPSAGQLGSNAVTVRVTTAGASYVTQPFSITVVVPPPAPAAPILIPVAGVGEVWCSALHNFSWTAVTPQDADPVYYNVQLDTNPDFNTGNLIQSGWLAGTAWSYYLGSSNATWYWRVQARDNGHIYQTSSWSSTGSFTDGNIYWDCNCDGSCSSSCPLVYSYDGSQYAYESDLAGPVLSQTPKGPMTVNLYQPIYMPLAQLMPDANNEYRVKVWESLQEGTMLDEAKLLAVDYPAGYEIVSSSVENTYYNGYVNPFSIYTLKNPVLPVAATDKNGTNVLSSLLSVDDYPAPITANASDNYYILDFGTIQHPEYAKLVIDGWMIINSKLYTSPVFIKPYIEVKDPSGNWVKVKTFGMPAGDMKRMVVDLSNLFLSTDHRIKVNLGVRKTTLWVIDRIRLDDSAPVPVTTQELSPSSADLQAGGQAITEMSTLQHRIHVGENLPLKTDLYGYGNFTRYGEVKELLTQRDDKYVIMNYADKVELKFPALTAPQAGMNRAFMIKADLYYKEFKDYKYLEPLPFHGMSSYPYPATESYPTDEDHNQYRLQYNTRVFAPPAP